METQDVIRNHDELREFTGRINIEECNKYLALFSGLISGPCRISSETYIIKKGKGKK